jgi:hypothetical protein
MLLKMVVLCLPLSRYGHKDTLVWRATNSGKFFVKSAYHLEKEKRVLQHGEGSDRSGYSKIWKSIWRLTVPNSVKVFMWRACNNLIPTKGSLQKRGIVKDSFCIFCNQEREDVKHVLWDYP